MEKEYLSVDAGVVVDGKIYTVDNDTGFFVCIDSDNGKMSLIADLQPESVKHWWVEKILYYDGWFYLISRNSTELVRVNRKGIIETCIPGENYNDNNLFISTGAVIIKDVIYILPGTLGGDIVCYNIISGRVEKRTPLKEIIENEIEVYNGYIIYDYYFDKNTFEVFFAITDTNLLLKMALETFSYEVYQCDRETRFTSITNGIGDILIGEMNFDSIWRLDRDALTFYRYGGHSRKNGYVFGIGLNDSIARLDDESGEISIYSREGDLEERIRIPQQSNLIYEIRKYNGRFSRMVETEDTVFMLPFSTNGVVSIDRKSRK